MKFSILYWHHAEQKWRRVESFLLTCGLVSWSVDGWEDKRELEFACKQPVCYVSTGGGEDSVCTCARGQLQHPQPHAPQLPALSAALPQGQCALPSLLIIIIVYGAPSHKSSECLQRYKGTLISSNTRTHTPTHTHPPTPNTCIAGDELVKRQHLTTSHFTSFYSVFLLFLASQHPISHHFTVFLCGS